MTNRILNDRNGVWKWMAGSLLALVMTMLIGWFTVVKNQASKEDITSLLLTINSQIGDIKSDIGRLVGRSDMRDQELNDMKVGIAKIEKDVSSNSIRIEKIERELNRDGKNHLGFQPGEIH